VTVCKTVHICYQTVVLSVCNVGVLCPNNWMDQDETWRGGRLRPWPHCVRWDPAPAPQNGHSPQFLANICCGQTAGWIKMPLGTMVGLSRGHIVLHDTQIRPKRGIAFPVPIFGTCLLWQNGCPSQLLLSTCYGHPA